MNRKIGVAAAGVVISLAAVTGCSNTASNVPASPISVLRAALAAASKDNTVKATQSVTGNRQNYQMSVAQQFSPPRFSERATVGVGTTGVLKMSEVYDGTKLYLKVPQLSALVGRKPWVQIGPSSVGGADSSIQSLLGAAKDVAPNSSIAPLLASRDLKSLGTETVDGLRATCYSGTLDAAQVASMLPTNGLTADQVQQIKQSFQQDAITSETLDVWINSENLPVRQKSLATTKVGTVTTTIGYSDWGAPVSITDPPRSEVGMLKSSAF